MSQQESNQTLDAHIDDLIDKIDVNDCYQTNADCNYSCHLSSSYSEAPLFNPSLPLSYDDEQSNSVPRSSKKLKKLDFKHPYQEMISTPLIHDSPENITEKNEELTVGKINKIEAYEIRDLVSVNQVINFVYKYSQRWPSTFQSVLIDQHSNFFLYLKHIMERIERPLQSLSQEMHTFSSENQYFTLSNKNKMSTYRSFSIKQQMKNLPKKSRTTLRFCEAFFNKPSLSWTNSSSQVFEPTQSNSNQMMMEKRKLPMLCTDKSDNFMRPHEEVQHCTLNEVISYQHNESINHSHSLKKIKLRTEVFGYAPFPWHGMTAADNFELFPETMRRNVHTLPIIAETSNEVAFSNSNTHINKESFLPLNIKESDKANNQRIRVEKLGPLSFLDKQENAFDKFSYISIKHTMNIEEPTMTLIHEEESNLTKYSDDNNFPVTSNLDSTESQNEYTWNNREDALSAFTTPKKFQNENQLVPEENMLNDQASLNDNASSVEYLCQCHIQHSPEKKSKIHSMSCNIQKNYGTADVRLKQRKSPLVVVHDKNEDRQEMKQFLNLNQKNASSVLVIDKSFLNSNSCPDMIKPYNTVHHEEDTDEEHRVPECSFNDHESDRETSMYCGQNQNLKDSILPSKGAFYWNNENSNGNEPSVTSLENQALGSIPRISQCNRPIRVGLSKKQKVKHLHKK